MTLPTRDRAWAVVTVTYNSARLLPDFLAALGPAVDGAGPVRIVAVDNASTDGSPDLVRGAMPDAEVVVLDRNRGYAAGVNAGIAAVSERAGALVLNPDVRLGAGALARLRGALEVPGTGIAAPRLVDERGRLIPTLRREPTVARAIGEAVLGGFRAGRIPALGELVPPGPDYDRPGEFDWASGAALALSARCLDAVGPWDERYFLYSEETDYALRARAAGFRLRYEPGATGIHIGGESHGSPRLWSMLTVNRVRAFRRWHGPLPSAAFGAAVLLNEGSRAIVGPGRDVHRAAVSALLRRSRRPAEVGGRM